jgi:hypothetical protein
MKYNSFDLIVGKVIFLQLELYSRHQHYEYHKVRYVYDI